MVLSIQRPPDLSRQEPFVPSNRLLSALSASEYQRIALNLERVFLSTRTIIYQPNQLIQDVYFPIQGMISLVSTADNGSVTGIANVGNEGMLGLSALLGEQFFLSQAIVPIDCVAMRLAANTIKNEFARGNDLQRILLLYTHVLLTQLAQNVVCSAQHTLEQRFARLLLSLQTKIQRDKLSINQAMIAELLGVRRPSLSVVARNLQARGIIRYSRGRIVIRNQDALTNISCECDREIAQEYSQTFLST